MRRRSGFTLIELLCVVAMIAILAALTVPNFLEAQTRSKIAFVRSDMAVLEAGLRAYYADHGRYPPNNPAVRAELALSLGKEERARAGEDSEGSKWLLAEPTPTPTPTPRVTPTPTPASSYGPYAEVYGSSGGYDALFGGNWGSLPPRQAWRKRAFELSGWDLAALTTPIPYFSRGLPIDNFFQADPSERAYAPPNPFGYFNLADDLHAFAVRDGTPARRFLLYSRGPFRESLLDGDPLHAPWTEYDPTNGTISLGVILRTGAGGR